MTLYNIQKTVISLAVSATLSAGMATVSYGQEIPATLIDTDMDGVFTPASGIDQMLDFNAAKSDTVGLGGEPPRDYAQSFTSEVSGMITAIWLPIRCTGVVDQNVTVALHTISDPSMDPPTDGDDGNLVASVVTSTSVINSTNLNFASFEFAEDARHTVTAGDKLSIVITGPGGFAACGIFLRLNDSSIYTGGDAFSHRSTGWNIGLDNNNPIADIDLPFAVVVEQASEDKCLGTTETDPAKIAANGCLDTDEDDVADFGPDGVDDSGDGDDDQCTTAEANKGDVNANGCFDNDGDGVADFGADGVVSDDGDDQCTTAEANKSNVDDNGCLDNDGDGVADFGADGVVGGDNDDNCPMDMNSEQGNNYGEKDGEACAISDNDLACLPDTVGDDCDNSDGDTDDDGMIFDARDNCPLTVNSDQENTYGNRAIADGETAGEACAISGDDPACLPDTVGDVCDDSDSDGVFDSTDKEPLVPNVASGFCFPVMGDNGSAVVCL